MVKMPLTWISEEKERKNIHINEKFVLTGWKETAWKINQSKNGLLHLKDCRSFKNDITCH